MIVGLLGNPNSGKSSIFNQLTGLRQKIGNFPGVTVDKKLGSIKFNNGDTATVIDLPGTYSLYPTSQDERIVLNIVANESDPNRPDVIVYIADVTHLEKHLLLFTQLQDLGFPMLLALNMSDVADKEGMTINADALSKSLNIPVIKVSGRTGNNMDALKVAIQNLQKQPAGKPFYQFSTDEKKLAESIQHKYQLETPYQALLWAHHFDKLPFLSPTQQQAIGNQVASVDFKSLHFQIQETMQRYDGFVPIVQKAIKKAAPKTNSRTDRLDAILTHKIAGPFIFFSLMLLVFQAIFAWASYPMDWIEQIFGAAGESLKAVLPAGWFTDLLTDGVLAGLGGVLVFIPQIAILFFLISLLEEVGYMARAVFMFDKLMQRFGLNGRSIVALISGGACAIPAVMSTRTIGNWKERLITIMVTPLISCSARIPVYTVLIGFVVPAKTVGGIFNLQGLAFMGLYLLGIIAALGSAYVFKKVLKSNERSFLTIELPTYRPPIFKNVLLTVWEKVKTFAIEAGKIILIISIVLWFLASYGPPKKMEQAQAQATTLAQEQNLDEAATANLMAAKQIEASYAGHIGKFIEPTIRPLGFDWKIGIALVTSFAAREVFVGTMATIYSIGSESDEFTIRDQMAKETNAITGKPVYNLATSLSLLIFYVFAMQCMSTLAVVKRETKSWKWPTIQFVFMSAMAYLSSLLVYQLLA